MQYNSANDTFTDGLGRTVSAKSIEQGELPRMPSSPQPSYTVGRGGTEVQFMGDGTARTVRDQDRSSVFNGEFAREGDLLSTAKSAQGLPVTGRDLRPTDTVEFRGMRSTLAVFEREGKVTRDATGRYVATAEGNAGVSAPKGPEVKLGLSDGGTVEEAAQEAFRADDATEATMTELVGSVDHSTQTVMLNSYLGTGEIDARAIERAAAQAGIEPEEMAAKVQAAQAGMEQAVEGLLAQHGVHDTDLFAEFIHGNGERLHAAREATRALLTANSTQGLRELADSFAENLDRIDPAGVTEALEASGIPFRRDGQSGKLLLTIDGYQVSFGQAVKAGMIKVRKA
jgi:hypothetical protein